jgi:hypothetical protein
MQQPHPPTMHMQTIVQQTPISISHPNNNPPLIISHHHPHQAQSIHPQPQSLLQYSHHLPHNISFAHYPTPQSSQTNPNSTPNTIER